LPTAQFARTSARLAAAIVTRHAKPLPTATRVVVLVVVVGELTEPAAGVEPARSAAAATPVAAKARSVKPVWLRSWFAAVLMALTLPPKGASLMVRRGTINGTSWMCATIVAMATELSPSGIAPVPSNHADVAAADYLQTRGWLYADHFAVGSSGVASFSDEAELWRAALDTQDFYETRRVTLTDVVLTDWVPRSPGRYHTPQANAARDEAKHRILERRPDHVVYDAAGKTSMVQGGIGCLRLTMRDVGGQQIKFLGATSSGIVHRSFVVALTDDQYASVADVIAKHGGVRCTIAGTVRYWAPEQKLDLFMTADVPRVYVGVDDLHHGTLAPTELPRLDVTPAITFEADGQSYFAYSHFHPADSGHVAHAVDWMSDYVTERYHGRVVTDFDELVTRFADTTAPLRTLMNPDIPVEKIAASFARYVSKQSLIVINTNFGEVVMGDKYDITGSQVGAVGPGAHVERMTFVQQQPLDIEALAEELGRLRVALREHGSEPEHDLALGEVAAAEKAAKEGDSDGALRHLKQAGQWALGVATEIGVPVATAALKSVLS
jgi:hypothetical protein